MADLTRPSGRPERADARRNRERVLTSAQRIFARDGVDAQIDDVARDAGVSVGTIYRNFVTKDGLLVELIRRKLRHSTEHVERTLAEAGDPFEAIVLVLQTLAADTQRDAMYQQVLAGFGEDVWLQARPEQRVMNERLAELVARAVTSGRVRPDTTADDISMLMCGICATMAHSSAGYDWRRHLELAIDMLRAR